MASSIADAILEIVNMSNLPPSAKLAIQIDNDWDELTPPYGFTRKTAVHQDLTWLARGIDVGFREASAYVVPQPERFWKTVLHFLLEGEYSHLSQEARALFSEGFFAGLARVKPVQLPEEPEEKKEEELKSQTQLCSPKKSQPISWLSRLVGARAV